MDRDKLIRDAAYAIWEAEGRPSGRDRQHWLQAEHEVSQSAKPAKPKKAEPSKSAAPPTGAAKKASRGKKA